jgi:hypothetical protein
MYLAGSDKEQQTVRETCHLGRKWSVLCLMICRICYLSLPPDAPTACLVKGAWTVTLKVTKVWYRTAHVASCASIGLEYM